MDGDKTVASSDRIFRCKDLGVYELVKYTLVTLRCKVIIAINKSVAMLTTCGCIRDFSLCTAGKSTLLQILAGKRLISSPGTDVSIKGRDVFRQTPDGITFLGTEWCADLKLGTLICRQASEGFLCLQCTDSDPLMTTGR